MDSQPAPKQILYVCGDCGEERTLKQGEEIRCSSRNAPPERDSHHQKHHENPPPPPPPPYGTFQGVANHPPPPAMGFPQPVPPPGVSGAPPPHYYAHGYQAVPGYAAVATGRPVREHRLPCCGIGLGWFFFITGFFLAAIPWYIAAFLLLCSRIDPREKPGYVACMIAAVLATFALLFGMIRIGD